MNAFTADPHSLQQAIGLLQGKRVLIVGDVMLDVYLEGDAERISPEAPVPVVNIAGERRMLGGAANVAHNIRALGGVPCLVGLCGAGRDGDILAGLLDEAGITAHLVRSSERRTIVKTRVMARGQQMLRLDKEDCLAPTAAEEASLGAHLDAALAGHSVLVISDYAKGLLTPSLRQRVQSSIEASARPVEILVDPKPGNAACYHNIGLMTPNRREASLLAGMELRSREDIVEAGRRIMRTLACQRLLITLGGDGMALFMEDGSVWNIPTATKAVFDVTGAGDTVIATVALARAAGIALTVGCALANYAAGGVLEHVGVATVSAQELRALAQRGPEPHFIPWVQEAQA